MANRKSGKPRKKKEIRIPIKKIPADLHSFITAPPPGAPAPLVELVRAITEGKVEELVVVEKEAPPPLQMSQDPNPSQEPAPPESRPWYQGIVDWFTGEEPPTASS
jgi:hypothetical protein